jgi:hypothetical protein
MTALTEAALAIHLAAAVDDHQPGRWITGDTIGYVRTGSGNEIDFGTVPVPASSGTAVTTPLESKWVARSWRSEALVIENTFGRGILATKDIVDLSHVAWAVPAPMLALLLA